MFVETRGVLKVEALIEESELEYWRYKFYQCGAMPINSVCLQKFIDDPCVQNIAWFDHPLLENLSCLIVLHSENDRDMFTLYTMRINVFHDFIQKMVTVDWKKDGF